MKDVSTLRIEICASSSSSSFCGIRTCEKPISSVEEVNTSTYLLSDEMGAECEGVTTGEGAWWFVPLSLVRTGDSVFTVLDADVANFKEGENITSIFVYNILK